jgi:hypothetical protein
MRPEPFDETGRFDRVVVLSCRRTVSAPTKKIAGATGGHRLNDARIGRRRLRRISTNPQDADGNLRAR